MNQATAKVLRVKGDVRFTAVLVPVCLRLFHLDAFRVAHHISARPNRTG